MTTQSNLEDMFQHYILNRWQRFELGFEGIDAPLVLAQSLKPLFSPLRSTWTHLRMFIPCWHLQDRSKAWI